ncbi:uncharacterized protein EKO05_0010216 [Ascochyta rabiei]|uniref:uncharacterized protein n=1 Tax=Didymella rabiei TaxID=5454 RepID=UPI002209824A|nr:uncharacterized protein EKO05_0010216 [Ascochyta rabiei]UPX19968.1 hypothetical protein EKO05_0010216 [Ascochyta rabiei]
MHSPIWRLRIHTTHHHLLLTQHPSLQHNPNINSHLLRPSSKPRHPPPIPTPLADTNNDHSFRVPRPPSPTTILRTRVRLKSRRRALLAIAACHDADERVRDAAAACKRRFLRVRLSARSVLLPNNSSIYLFTITYSLVKKEQV